MQLQILQGFVGGWRAFFFVFFWGGGGCQESLRRLYRLRRVVGEVWCGVCLGVVRAVGVTYLGVFQEFIVCLGLFTKYIFFTLPAITLSNYNLYHEMRHPTHLVPIPKILVFVMALKLTFPKDLKISQNTTEPWHTKPSITLVKPTSI